MNKQNNLPDSIRIFMRSINVDGKPQPTDILKGNDVKLTANIETPNICVVMSQEDYRTEYTPSLLPGRFNLANSVTKSLNPNSTEQNIKIEVLYDDTVAPNKSETGIIAVSPKKGTKGAIVASGQKILSIIPGSGLGLTKGAVWCKLIYTDCNIVFVSMHLPIDTKAEDLGNEYRKQSLQYILNELKNKNIIDSNSYAFFGGDLNFRMIPTDQMGPAIQEIVKNPSFANLSEISNITGNKTCRLVKEGPCSDNVYRARDTNCFTDDRAPSYCDRFLALPPESGDRSFFSHSFFSSHLIKTSDHNAVSIGVDLIKKLTIESGGVNGNTAEQMPTSQIQPTGTAEILAPANVSSWDWNSTRKANRRTSLPNRVTSPMTTSTQFTVSQPQPQKLNAAKNMSPQYSPKVVVFPDNNSIRHGGKRTKKARKTKKAKNQRKRQS